MDKSNGLGRTSGEFQPRELPHSGSPKSQKSQSVAVQNNLPNQTPRHKAHSLSGSQSISSRSISSTFGQSYLKGSARGGILEYVEDGLKNKKRITVNDDAALGNRKLSGACKQFEGILQKLNNEHLGKVDDLSFLGERFTEQFNRINQGEPEEIAKIVVELSNSFQKWYRNIDFQNVTITGTRIQQLDKECKAILNIFMVEEVEDNDSGIGSEPASDTESIPESIGESEWEDEDSGTTENSRTIAKPPKPETIQRPKQPASDSFNPELDDGSVIESGQGSSLRPEQYDRHLTVKDEEVSTPAGQYKAASTSMTVKNDDVRVKPQEDNRDITNSGKPAATQTPKPAGLQSISTEILKGELPDPELDGLKESLSQAELRADRAAEGLRTQMASQTQQLQDAEVNTLKLRSDAERLSKEMGNLADENVQLQRANQSQKEALDEATVAANQARDRADRAEKTAEGLRKWVTSQTQELKEAEADALKLRSDAERLSKEVGNLADENVQLQRTNQSQKKDLNAVRIELSNSKEQVTSLSKAAHEKQQILEEAEEKYRKQSEENVSLKSQLERSAEEKLVIESQRFEALSRADTSKNENSALKKEIEKLRALISSQDKQLAEFYDMKNKLEIEKEDFKEQQAGLNQRIADAVEKQVDLENELSVAREQLGQQNEIRIKAENSLRKLEIDMSSNLRRLERELKISEGSKKQLESTIHEKDRKINNLTFEFKSQGEKVKSLEKEAIADRFENTDLKSQLKLQKIQAASAEEALNKNRRQIEREQSQHKTELSLAKKEIQQIKAKLNTTQDDLQRVIQEKRKEGGTFAGKERKYQDRVATLEREVGVLGEELLQAKERVSGLESQEKKVKGVSEDNRVVREKLEKVEAELAVKKAELSKLVGKNNIDIFNHYLNEMLRAMDERDELSGKKEIEISAAVIKGKSEGGVDGDTLGVHDANRRLAIRLRNEENARKESDRLLNEKIKEVEDLKIHSGKYNP